MDLNPNADGGGELLVGADRSGPTQATAGARRAPRLSSTRVSLRPLHADDGDDLYVVYADPAVARHWSFPAWTRRTQAQDYLRLRLSLLPPAVYCWAITHGDERLIGTVTLFALDASRGCEIGYALASAFHGRGLASEALRLVISHAFETLALARIEADVDPRNEASWRLLERLGFRREALLHDRCRRGDEVGDAAIYALLRAHWDAPRA
jgi:RimJ/RimL family protein N-acetyltransferase